jgi:hypothetical protein
MAKSKTDDAATPAPDGGGTPPAAAPDVDPQYADWLGRRPVTAETRHPFGGLVRRLDNSPPPTGFHAHWFNDDAEGRIDRALAAGYAMMTDKNGSPIRKLVGTKRSGGGMYAYRMMVPIEWWLQDKGKIEEARKQVEADMARGVIARGAPGVDGRYLPTRAGQPINTVTTTDGRIK